MVMKKALHLAIASIRAQKGAAASMFAIIILVSALLTIGLSLVIGVMDDYNAEVERLNGLHSVFVMTKDTYLPAYEDIIKNDPRVVEYDIGEVIFNGQLTIDYGGELEHRVMILNADDARTISAFHLSGDGVNSMSDTSGGSLGSAVYLPEYAMHMGFEIGSPFKFNYRNRPVDLRVAGYFESSEYSMSNGAALKFFAADECYKELKQLMGSSVWIAIRFDDPYYSTQFNETFLSEIDVEIAFFAEDSFVMDYEGTASNSITPIMIFTSILLIYALVIILILLLVTRFRVINSIEDTMHSIGVLKAAGYTGKQIIASYVAENSIMAIPAAMLGVLLAIPSFSVIRKALASMSGSNWSLGASIPVGLIAATLVIAFLILTALHSCRNLRKLQPVDALRGEVALFSRRRNAFPLHRGAGSVHTRLGLKSASSNLKRHVMSGLVLAAATFVIIIIAAMYQNFVINRTALTRMIGIELADVDLSVARHTDAAALATELLSMPEVRKTAMLDWRTFQIDGISVMGFVSDDFGLFETMLAHDGRFPIYDNEIAIPKLLADRLGKVLGDSVKVKANGVTQEFIISGYYSSANNGGQIGSLTLEGYQRLDLNYIRNNIKVYLNEGVSFEAFSDMLISHYGVVNVYLPAENDKFGAAKARAEEKIANYLKYFGIDSVEYAVIYNGEIILSGSSDSYQIEKITDFKAWADSQITVYGEIVRLLTQVVSIISLAIIAAILTMTARQIVVKRRRELGILKSCGFTSKQLTKQLAISFLPCSLLGAAIGCVGGTFMVNPAITAMFSSTGVYNANVYIYPPAAIAIGILTLLFSFAVVNISAMRIRRITAYELISE